MTPSTQVQVQKTPETDAESALLDHVAEVSLFPLKKFVVVLLRRNVELVLRLGLRRLEGAGQDAPARSVAVRTASKSEKKPPTAIILGDESRRWREGTAAPRDAEIVRVAPHNRELHDSIQYGRTNTRSDRRQEPGCDDLGDAVQPGKVLEGHVRRAVPIIVPRIIPDDTATAARHQRHANHTTDAGVRRRHG